MPRDFEIRKEIALPATPEQVWDAITTRAGLTAWFMPMDDAAPDGAGVAAWDPPKHFAIRIPAAADGSTQAFEYVIEGREGGTTVLRFVHSGVLGDDWSDEFEGMTGHGWDMYLHTLAQYLTYFAGRPATYILAEAPPPSADPAAWPVLLEGLGLAGAPVEGAPVRLAIEGIPAIDGVIDYAGPSFAGIRTSDALYRFHGRAALGMPIAVGHHIYTDVDAQATQQAWKSWLDRLFS